MLDAHIIIADETAHRPNKWRWSCSCGKESDAKGGYPSKQNALNGGAVHRLLVTLGR